MVEDPQMTPDHPNPEAIGNAFDRLMRRLIHVPKAELEAQERHYERTKAKRQGKPRKKK
jgi:hypothetical protein